MSNLAEAGGTVFDREMIALRGYWLKQVARHAERGTLRPDRPRSDGPGPDGPRQDGHRSNTAAVAVDIAGEVHEKLSRLVGDGSFLLYATLVASLKACVYKYTSSTFIVVG